MQTGICQICGVTFSYRASSEPGYTCSLACDTVRRNPLVKREYLTYDHLFRLYVIEGFSLRQIGRQLNTSNALIRKWLKKLEIPLKLPTGSFSVVWRQIDHHGYVYIKKPDHPYANRHGFVREHRLVMEKRIGRYLTPDEHVHHKDHNRQNNYGRGNLILISPSAHSRVHMTRERAIRMNLLGQAKRQEKIALRPKTKPCKCGCRKLIDLTKYDPGHLPEFLNGHWSRWHANNAFATWLQEHAGKYCACGCGQMITLTRYHFQRSRALPIFIHGHNGRKSA